MTSRAWSRPASPTTSGILNAPNTGTSTCWHAQDGISGNALATLSQRNLIPGFARTVHHIDAFADPRVSALQSRSITAADRLFAVSRLWRDWLVHELGRDVSLVGNGVDTSRFSAKVDATDAALRARLRLPAGRPVFLADRRRRGAQEYDPDPRGVSHGSCEASVVPPRDRGRRFAAGPRQLPGPLRRGARDQQPAGRRSLPQRTAAAGADARALPRRGLSGLSLDHRRVRPGGA